MINRNVTVLIAAFILLIGLQSYSYSSPDEVKKIYTAMQKLFRPTLRRIKG